MKAVSFKEGCAAVVRNGFALLLILFLCMLGFMSLVSAVESIYPGPFDPGGIILKLIAGIAFGGIGLGFLYFIFLQEAVSGWWFRYRQARYGDRPWLLRRAWRKGRIAYRPGNPAIILWIFALGWNSGLGMVLVGNRDLILEAVRENRLNALGVALFVLIGLGTLYGALRMTFTKKVSGRAVFTMDAVPGVVGGKLKGWIRTRIPGRCAQPVTLKLSGSPSAPFERKVARGEMREDPKGLTIPVDFDIPDSCEGTSEWDPGHKVVWTLEASARVDEKEWKARFNVPVFKMAAPEGKPDGCGDARSVNIVKSE